ncbi:hypothetical protein LT85_2496 [Collimonas arenae]|uniref:Uncharacterized protein n=1 Tax=Collimonas arenae TaxID=279058 RepID=A0A0A1FD98_9BURK|nr:hypothetical protein LT85_2496 [Collimonas arenae]
MTILRQVKFLNFVWNESCLWKVLQVPNGFFYFFESAMPRF